MGESFDTDLPLERRRELATARMARLAARVGGRVVQHEDRVVVEAETAQSRPYSLILTIHDDLPAGYGPTGQLALRVSVANRVGRIHVHNIPPADEVSDEEEGSYGAEPGEEDLQLRGTIHVRHRDPDVRAAMLAVAAKMPMDFVSALEELFASKPHTSLDLEDDGIDAPLAWMDLDDEEWAYLLESLEVQVAAIDRVAAVVEGATPGRTTSCRFCRMRFVVLADHRCPHCGAPMQD